MTEGREFVFSVECVVSCGLGAVQESQELVCSVECVV